MIDISEAAQAFLLELHAAAGGDASMNVSMFGIGSRIGLEKAEAGRIGEELIGCGLVDVRTLSGDIGMTDDGIDAAQRLGAGGGAASEAYRLAPDAVLDDRGAEEVGTRLAAVKDKVGTIGLDFDAVNELVADLKTAEAQMASPRPKTGILRECLRSIADALEQGNAGELPAAIRHLAGE